MVKKRKEKIYFVCILPKGTSFRWPYVPDDTLLEDRTKEVIANPITKTVTRTASVSVDTVTKASTTVKSKRTNKRIPMERNPKAAEKEDTTTKPTTRTTTTIGLVHTSVLLIIEVVAENLITARKLTTKASGTIQIITSIRNTITNTGTKRTVRMNTTTSEMTVPSTMVPMNISQAVAVTIERTKRVTRGRTIARRDRIVDTITAIGTITS
ncbi:hypothetical protein K501DRAFT_279409 [Backusella circina FSU 941]|nr:hypothetical protein K501DRAFT_279409 [Backusella circina FSU 941]